jgi:hypothetical protein
MEASGQLYALAALHRLKTPRYPLGRRLCGPRNRYGLHGEEKKIPTFPPAGERTTVVQIVVNYPAS